MSGPFKMKGFPAHAGVSPMKDKDNSLKEAAKVTKAQLKGEKVIAVDDESEIAKKHKAEWEAEQARKKAEKKKKEDHKKVGDDNVKYHMEQARAQGISWPEYKKKLKKRTRGY